MTTAHGGPANRNGEHCGARRGRPLLRRLADQAKAHCGCYQDTEEVV